MFADVGSGIGNFSLEVAKIRPDFTFILEDRPPVMEKARKVSIVTNTLFNDAHRDASTGANKRRTW